MPNEEGHQEDRIRELIETFSVGNPLVDQEAYEKALRDCPDDESRALLRAIRETVRDKSDEFLRRLVEISNPPPEEPE